MFSNIIKIKLTNCFDLSIASINYYSISVSLISNSEKLKLKYYKSVIFYITLNESIISCF